MKFKTIPAEDSVWDRNWRAEYTAIVLTAQQKLRTGEYTWKNDWYFDGKEPEEEESDPSYRP
jgi:hypothetical protein